MMRLFVTTDFCKGCHKLLTSNRKTEVSSLRTVLISLANNKPIPKKYHDHQLTGKDYRELHVSGDVLLIYKYEADKNTLVVSLKLTNITDHKRLDHDAARSDYDYYEVSTEDLHDITSSMNLTELDETQLNDLLESISDYASTYLNNGYVILEKYFLEGSNIHCYYDYYSYVDDSESADSIDFVINLDDYNIDYNISYLNKYLDEFSYKVAHQFLAADSIN